MVKVISSTVSKAELSGLASEIGGFYIKIVVDLENRIMAAGAKMHMDEEQLLLKQGSKKDSLWGGGYDLEVKQITFDSIINNKPGINSSSDILDPGIRNKFEIITRKLLGI
jgi:Protein of unknown function (DUF5674)